MRVRSIIALLVAGMLLAAGVASAQDTTTEPLSDYTTTTPTVTTPTTPTSTVGGETQTTETTPNVASQSAGNAPSSLAFTGADPLLLIALGLGLAGGTTALLVRERRRSSQGR